MQNEGGARGRGEKRGGEGGRESCREIGRGGMVDREQCEHNES